MVVWSGVLPEYDSPVHRSGGAFRVLASKEAPFLARSHAFRDRGVFDFALVALSLSATGGHDTADMSSSLKSTDDDAGLSEPFGTIRRRDWSGRRID
jgi:hypothetical protein